MLYGDCLFINEWIQSWRHKYLPLTMKSEGCSDVIQNVSIQVRQLPLGLYELIFPKEHKDIVLATLKFDKSHAYNLDKRIFGISPINMLRKFLHIQIIPKFDNSKKFVMPKYDVSVIPIGVKYDGEITEKEGDLAGYTHEAL